MNAALALLLPSSTRPAKKKSKPGEKGKKKDTIPAMIRLTPRNIRINRIISEALFGEVLKLANQTEMLSIYPYSFRISGRNAS